MILSINDQITQPLKVKDHYGSYLRKVNVYCLYEFNPKFKKAKL
jgi:hypothetical protein